MSLIQEALEKAGKVPLGTPRFEAPKQEPLLPPAEKSKSSAVLSRAIHSKPEAEKLESKIEISPRVLIRMGAVLGLILLFLGIAALLSRAGKSSSVMMAGVSSAASQSSMLPAASPAPSFVLTGITDSGDSKLALINNQVVGVGDRLKEKAFVRQIGQNYAVLDYNGKQIHLNL